MRAIIFWKGKKIRPIGIGDVLRRAICRCLARQDRELWDAFLTSMLPEDAEARDLAIAEAKEALDIATSALKAAHDGGERVPTGFVASAEAAHAAALGDLEEAQLPVNFPSNLCCSSDGTGLTNATVEVWKALAPSDHIIKDDKRIFYQESSRPDFFTALGTRSDFPGYKPVYRTFYGKQKLIGRAAGGAP